MVCVGVMVVGGWGWGRGVQRIVSMFVIVKLAIVNNLDIVMYVVRINYDTLLVVKYVATYY